MLYGYNGKMLFVDLTTGEIKEKELTEEIAYNFIGGIGLGARILYEMMPANADPLGPDNVLGFVTNMTNGTKALFGGRYTVVCKSPLSNTWNDANSGGVFGPTLKRAGYDAVFFSGISEKPVYLWVNDGKAELRDAGALWGKIVPDTQKAIKEELGDSKVSVCAIGPSGENLSLISCPINDEGRAPARGGLGAVMGSKKLKAIVVKGTGKIAVADDAKILDVNKQIQAAMKESPAAGALGMFGTGVGTAASALSGDAPVKNWDGVGVVDFPEEMAEKVTSIALDRYKVKAYHCANCPLGCGAIYEVNDGKWPIGITERPEYETAAVFGSNLLCDSSDVVLICNHICNVYGLDTISAGQTVAWAMECYEKGALTKEDLDGIDLTWGNDDAIVALTEKMAKGEGCGAILQNGSAYAARYYKKGEEYLQTASNVEPPAHDVRFAPGFGRTYQYDPSPGRHTKGGLGPLQSNNVMPPGMETHDYNNKVIAGFDAAVTSASEIQNSCGLCIIGGSMMPMTAQNDFIAAITGMDFNQEVGYMTGLRILNMRQAFNLRDGIKPADMTLSERLRGEPSQKVGPLEGITVDVEQLGRNFFEAMEWDFETGIPSKESLERLGGLDIVIKDLYPEE